MESEFNEVRNESLTNWAKTVVAMDGVFGCLGLERYRTHEEKLEEAKKWLLKPYEKGE